MCAILQLVSAPLNPRPIADHFRRSHPLSEHSYWTNVSKGKENKFETVVWKMANNARIQNKKLSTRKNRRHAGKQNVT